MQYLWVEQGLDHAAGHRSHAERVQEPDSAVSYLLVLHASLGLNRAKRLSVFSTPVQELGSLDASELTIHELAPVARVEGQQALQPITSGFLLFQPLQNHSAGQTSI